jgi:hypothetical protein
MIQKLMQHIDRVRLRYANECTTPIGANDVSYEAGRRIGVVQGIDQTLLAIKQWVANSDEKDKDL